MGNNKYKLYNAISPYNVHFFDGAHEKGSGFFDPKKGIQIIQSPVYETGINPFKIKFYQYADPLLKKEVLHVHNLGTPFTYKVSNVLQMSCLYNWPVLFQ